MGESLYGGTSICYQYSSNSAEWDSMVSGDVHERNLKNTQTLAYANLKCGVEGTDLGT